MQRTIRRTLRGKRTVDGAGVELVRVIDPGDAAETDPFLLLDVFDATDASKYSKGFPMHPHRGIETFTYLIAGAIEHRDHMGNRGMLRDGGAQWMSGGRGVMHEEMPQPSPRLQGFQLWVNLPAAHKMDPPDYRDIAAQDVRWIERGNHRIGVAAGEYLGVAGPIASPHAPATVLDVCIEAPGDVALPAPGAQTALLFAFQGDVRLADGTQVPSHMAVLFGEGDEIALHADAPARLMLYLGAPTREPIAWGGPVVMNTQEELRHAFAQLRDGTFLDG